MLTTAARQGAVSAMTALLKHHENAAKERDAKSDDPFGALDEADELTQRREQRAA